MDDCELFDLGFSGPKFSWKNRQDAQSNVHVRLDRAVANGAFPARFENFNVENVITTSSDHYAMVISLDSAKLRLENSNKCSMVLNMKPCGRGRMITRRWWNLPGCQRQWTQFAAGNLGWAGTYGPVSPKVEQDLLRLS